MADFLTTHAINNCWCNPRQDNQLILKPARLTTYGGAVRSWKFLWTSFNLPNNTDRFHIYSIGQIHPLLVNLFPLSNTWKLVSESNMLTDTITEIYTARGIRIPVSRVHYIFTEENSLLFAVPQDSNLHWDFNLEEIYVRLYDNAYFESSRSSGESIYVTGGKMGTTQDILDIQVLYLWKSALPGKVYCFRNGYRVASISLVNTSIGDTVEFYHDPSVAASYSFKMSELDTFDSVLDTKRKYFIHTGSELGSSIYYQDDIDIYILDETTGTGVYYHKNNVDNLRMVTHKDYSLSQPVCAAYASEHPGIFDYNTATIELNVRQSGYERPLVDEHSRIKELYKLPEEYIPAAMIGVESSLDIWRVDSLENGNYTKVMRSAFTAVTSSLVRDTYGYNAVVKLMASPVIKTEQFSGQTVGMMPVHYTSNATVYEYDTNGVYLSKHYHLNSEIYNCSNVGAGYLMIIHGAGGDTLDEYYNTPTVTLDPQYDYRFYAAPKDGVHPGTQWVDVTGTGAYQIIGNTLTWLNMSTHDVLARSNKVHLSKSFYIDPLGGAITFNLSHMQDVDGSMVDSIMQIPMGELKVFLNGRSLVRDLDYHVDFPVVTIVNKDYLVNQNTTQQKIDYVFTGLCSSDLEFSTYAENGFIRNGFLSVDNRFNIRDDKAIYITANGRIYLTEDLSFVEDSHEFVFDSALNGKPYCIEDAIVPIKSITNLDTYEYKELSTVVDTAVSDYLTLRMPEPVIPEVNPILAYYKLYSPFISKVIFSVLDNAIDPIALTAQYNDDRVRELVAPYLYLLDMDPIHVNNRPDMNYCIIHPHILSNVIEVNIYQYKFITRVVNLYGNGLINLSGHLAMV
jgi:hypothetical protein